MTGPACHRSDTLGVRAGPLLPWSGPGRGHRRDGEHTVFAAVLAAAAVGVVVGVVVPVSAVQPWRRTRAGRVPLSWATGTVC